MSVNRRTFDLPGRHVQETMLVLAAYLHGLWRVVYQIGQVSELRATSAPPQYLVDSLQAAAAALGWQLDAMSELVRDALREPEEARPVEECVSILVGLLRARGAEVEMTVGGVLPTDRLALQPIELRQLAEHLTRNQPRSVRLTVTAAKGTLSLNAVASRGLHSVQATSHGNMFEVVAGAGGKPVGDAVRFHIEFPNRPNDGADTTTK